MKRAADKGSYGGRTEQRIESMAPLWYAALDAGDTLEGVFMKPVIVTAATTQELALLISSLEGRERFQLCRRDAYRGEVGGRPVIAVTTGIGKVNTAAAVAVVLEKYPSELLINTGCAGAYPGSKLAVGDLAMARNEVFGDEGVATGDGWRSLELIGIPVVERSGVGYFNRYPLTGWAADKAAYVAQAAGVTLQCGTFVTLSTVSGTTARGAELAHRFQAICENMEGAAAVQVAVNYGVDCLEVRGISNLVEDRDLSRWDIPLAVERAQTFVLRFIASLLAE